MTKLKPALISADNKFVINPASAADQVLVDYIPIPDLISTDADQTMTLGSDGKLLTTGEVTVTCTFNMDELLSEDVGNIIGLSKNDGKLFAGQCILQVADWLSTDPDNGLGLGGDGKFWFDGTADCAINISNLLSQEAGNAIKLSVVDGKLMATLSADCDVNISKLFSSKADNRITINTADGLMYVPPFECVYDMADWVSNDTWNRLRLKTEAGGDGKLLVLSEEQVSTITNNRLKTHTAGDHKFYVVPADFISVDERPGLAIGTDGNIKVNPADLISNDTDSGLDVGFDGKLVVNWDVLTNLLFSANRFRLIASHTLPLGGTWAYISFTTKTDEDVESENYIAFITGVGVGAGGDTIFGEGDYWGNNPGRQTVVWRIA